MTDIRTTVELTAFPGADENPLSEGGNWAQVDSVDYPLQLAKVSNNATASTGGAVKVFSSRWTPLTLSGDMEVWGYPNGSMGNNSSYDFALFANTGGAGGVLDGYIGQWIDGLPDSVKIFRMDNGVATLLTNPALPTLPGAGQALLMRTNGTSVEIWQSVDGGANWVMNASAVDNTYRNNMQLVLRIIKAAGQSEQWRGFGGGQSGSVTSTIQLPYLGVGP